MINCSFAVCSQVAILDAHSNNLSLVNILEDITAPTFPVSVPGTYVTFALTRDSPDDVVDANSSPTVRIFSNGNMINENSIKVDFEQHLRTKAIIKYGVVPIPEPGNLKFTLFFGDQEIASATVVIKSSTGITAEQV